MSDNLPTTDYPGKMDSDKSGSPPDSMSNRSLIAILLGGIAVLSAVFYLIGPDRISDLASRSSVVGDKTAARTNKVEIASAEEIDTWIKSEMQQHSRPLAIVNVWATWCEPCRKEMPEIAKFQKTHPGVPVFLASADNESDLAAVEQFLAEAGVEFPSRLIRAPQDSFIELWQTRSSADPERRWSMSLPVTFFLNKEGNVERFLATETNSVELAAIASSLGADLNNAEPPKPSKPEDL